MTAEHVTRAWGCTVRLVVADRAALRHAAADLTALLDQVDRAASRFRPDSALARVNANSGRPVPVPRVLVDLVDAGIRAARETGGLVDPTLGLTLARLGYDRDFAELAEHGVRTAVGGLDADATPTPTAGWRGIRINRQLGLVTTPRGCALDLGASVKAWTADHAAQTLAARYDTGVLVELGGDVAVAGPYLQTWRIRVAEHQDGPGDVVTLHRGGLATSTTTVRHWTHDGRPVHHLLDPRTGAPCRGPWRTASVAAGSAFLANTASTAAIVLGTEALPWLEHRGLAARLVGADGRITVTSAWPRPTEADDVPAGTAIAEVLAP